MRIEADSSWPLIGRAKELEAVQAALRRDTGMVVAGAAGVGKTRIARDALAMLEREGASRGDPFGE